MKNILTRRVGKIIDSNNRGTLAVSLRSELLDLGLNVGDSVQITLIPDTIIIKKIE